jgi:S1-C subfamily serine protease
LTEQEEESIRRDFPRGTGLLIAEVVLPGVPAHKKLKHGDVLLRVNNEHVSQFSRLDDVLDSSIGQNVSFLIQRNGHEVSIEAEVDNLHAITSDRFLQVAEGNISRSFVSIRSQVHESWTYKGP